MNGPKLRAEAKARAEFEDVMQRLKLELAMNTPRRLLDIHTRLLEQLVEQTGGNLTTADMRVRLATVKKEIAHRGYPRLVRSN